MLAWVKYWYFPRIFFGVGTKSITISLPIAVKMDKHPNVSGLFNCGTGEARTFLDLAKSIFTAMGKEIVIDFVPTPKKIRGKYQYFTQANMGNLRLSGYSEEFTKLEDGVTLYVSNYLMSEDRYI
jgi:ADP-L-glycero-D-manno-heptose 6-epimerase